jgi:signal transduction histidine kinase
MKRYLTLIFLLFSTLLTACGVSSSTPVAIETPPVITPCPTLDRCSPAHLTAEIIRINKLMDEFDHASSFAIEGPQSQLVNIIPELQHMSRDAQDQDVPACLQPLKELQTGHMDAMIRTLIYLNGHPISATSPDPEVIMNINSGITQARNLHEKYDVEMSRLLDVTQVTPPPSPEVATPETQPATIPVAFVMAVAFLSLVSAFGFTNYLLKKRTKRSCEIVLSAEEKQGILDGKRLQSIYELTSGFSSALNYKQVLELALDVGISALRLDRADNDSLAGMAMLFDGGRLHIDAARRLTAADLNITVDSTDGILARTPDEKKELILFKDMNADLESGCATALRNYKSGYSLSIRGDFSVYGVLLFVHPDENYFNAERCSILKVIVRQLTTAVENISTHQDVVEEKERIIESYEESRKKLADRVHDGPVQHIADLVIRLNKTKHILKRDVKTAVEEIAKLEELAQCAVKEVSHIPVLLRPLTLESQGLVATLQAMADKMREIYDQRVIFDVDENIPNWFDWDKQSLIFYIIEEAVDNARKHAAAEIIAIRLHQTDDDIATLQIVDNGIGFDMDAFSRSDDEHANAPSMVNLRERVKMFRGLLQVDSMPGQGTLVQVYIPLPKVDKSHSCKTPQDYFLQPRLSKTLSRVTGGVSLEKSL